MKQEEFRRLLTSITPDAPERFSAHVDTVLGQIARQEDNLMNTSTRNTIRLSGRAAALALCAVLAFGAIAYAATQWGIFSSLSDYLGAQPPTADSVMQSDLHTETVNGVEISIKEAGYDGRTLFLQYSYRFPGCQEPLGELDAYGERMLSEEDMALLDQHGLGWWVDAFWVNGKAMDMATNSASLDRGSANPGEILHTEYWRLDNIDVELTGEVEIALPIGESQSAEYRNALYDRRSGEYKLPDRGVVTFSFDARDTLSRVTTLESQTWTVTPDVTARVREAAFTPLMTYITLELTPNPAALEAYKQEHGEGYRDEAGNLLWSYNGADVYVGWMTGLTLVDGDGSVLFPHAVGCNGVGESWAEFLFPYMDPEKLPEELWLAPRDGDMEYAIRVK